MSWCIQLNCGDLVFTFLSKATFMASWSVWLTDPSALWWTSGSAADEQSCFWLTEAGKRSVLKCLDCTPVCSSMAGTLRWPVRWRAAGNRGGTPGCWDPTGWTAASHSTPQCVPAERIWTTSLEQTDNWTNGGKEFKTCHHQSIFERKKWAHTFRHHP